MGVRFAPSPTGAFHFGNFRTAWISHAWARGLGEPWIVRFEDIDRPRVVAGAQERQLSEMYELGLRPDVLLVQSDFHARHWEVFLHARREGRIYPCFCSRQEVQRALEGASSAPHGAQVLYSGHCRSLTEAPRTALPTIAWRFRSEDASGGQDFIVARSAPVARVGVDPAEASFVPAYNWACAIDDFDGAYSLLVRAWDLDSVVPQQRAIHAMLSAWGPARAAPAVFHCSLVTHDDGRRLEKRSPGVTFEELKESGNSVHELIEEFRASFDEALLRGFAPSRIFGELRREVSLKDFGRVKFPT